MPHCASSVRGPAGVAAAGCRHATTLPPRWRRLFHPHRGRWMSLRTRRAANASVQAPARTTAARRAAARGATPRHSATAVLPRAGRRHAPAAAAGCRTASPSAAARSSCRYPTSVRSPAARRCPCCRSPVSQSSRSPPVELEGSARVLGLPSSCLVCLHLVTPSSRPTGIPVPWRPHADGLHRVRASRVLSLHTYYFSLFLFHGLLRFALVTLIDVRSHHLVQSWIPIPHTYSEISPLALTCTCTRFASGLGLWRLIPPSPSSCLLLCNVV